MQQVVLSKTSVFSHITHITFRLKCHKFKTLLKTFVDLLTFFIAS